MSDQKAKYCLCGKRYFKTQQEAKNFRYHMGKRKKLDPVMYYQCEYDSWHWSRSYLKNNSTVDIGSLADFSTKQHIKVKTILNHHTHNRKKNR